MPKDPHKEELIKQYNHSRAFIRKFYVYGFMHKEEFQKKGRTYDAEKHRIENWLKPYMRFEQDHHRKRHFIAVDSREITVNPLYRTLKTCTFTDRELLLHFLILDVLVNQPAGLSRHSIVSKLNDRVEKTEIYSGTDKDYNIGEGASLDRKLDELIAHGVILKKGKGRAAVYKLNENQIALDQWKDALAFFAEFAPLGIVGSFVLDRYHDRPSFFRFKRHFLFDALDSEILEQLLMAIESDQEVEITKTSKNNKTGSKVVVIPLKIMISMRNGRQYLLSYFEKMQRFCFHRIDLIDRVTILKNSSCNKERKINLSEKADSFRKNIWGTSAKYGGKLERLEMTIFAGEDEPYIVRRLKQEKRNGTVKKIDASHWTFSIDVYDANELLPWIRSFIGRITELFCSNEEVTKRFNMDLNRTMKLYEEECDDLQ